MAPSLGLKVAITATALVLVVARIVWPDVKVDAITLGLVIVAVLPWLTELIESAKFPGGWEVQFRDLDRAGEKIAAEAPAGKPKSVPEFLSLVEGDSNLALVALRIEIEKRLRKLGAQLNVPENLPLTSLFGELYRKGLLKESVFGALQEIVRAGNKAAHGASVEPGVRDWALNTGPLILGVLDGLLGEEQQP